MQLSVIRTRASERLNEAGTPVFYTAAEINAAINEGLRFFCLLTLCLEKTAAWSASGSTFTHMLTVFSDWICPLRIYTSTGAVLRISTLTDLNSLDPSWISNSGPSTRYTSIGVDLIGIYPQQADTLNVTYARAPLTLAADSDVPEIPAELHPLLVGYAIYRCRQVEGGTEFMKTLKYYQAFLDGADKFGKYVRDRNKGTRYDTPPFEMKLQEAKA